MEVEETVRLRWGSAVVGFAQLHEASLSGAFLRTRWRVPLLARIWVDMRDEAHGHHSLVVGPKLHVEAFVVRHTSDGIGLEWSEYAPTAIAELLKERHGELANWARDEVKLGHRRRSP